jgi:plastocyanin
MRSQNPPLKYALSASLFGLAFICSVAWSKDWPVKVGGTQTDDSGGYYGGSTTTPIIAFNPSQLSINVGDTVTFTNQGGAKHNVHADDNSWRCAAGCDATGGNGDPSAAGWTSTVTFNTAGTVKFHCDEHQAMGMTGTIVVNSVAAPQGKAITNTTSGVWYDHTQSGQGFMVEILPGNVFLAVWFTFAPQAATSQQNWLYIQGSFSPGDDSVTVAPVTGNARSGVLLNTGAAFPPNFSSTNLTTTQWGTMKFDFDDCNHATVTWNSPLPGYGVGTMNLERLAGVDGLTCQ